MNIYFSGIGGVGLGPLAQIALDAGHSVLGSDPHASLTSDELTRRGVTISTDQSGDFLRKAHALHKIDMLVYTSALPSDHPERTLAWSLGIKAVKRDELLLRILHENKQQLVAIAGTHGKTGTTAMMVWAMQQLGLPVSYSIGSNISFGPSGKLNPASDYFIYECDEFDRNFLRFHPEISVITALDYDHVETYATPQAYLDAFRQFTLQSTHTIAWSRDAQALAGSKVQLLADEEVLELSLPGIYTRRNATLLLEVFARMGVDKATAMHAIESFPGVKRRFEQLAHNLYSDYAHHPVEIAATLQMARELNQEVVAVYQPHQNTRQYQIRDQYLDCFRLASEVYWLPTYLSREDPSLAVLTPKELAASVGTQQPHIAELNTELWKTTLLALQRGALVLYMGAGSIDEWLRERVTENNLAL